MSDQEASAAVFRERIFPILFMLIVTVVFIALVSGIYLGTKDTVDRNELLYVERAVLYAANVPLPQSNSAIEDLYSVRVTEHRDAHGSIRYYEVAGTNGTPISYVVPASGPGLWGEIDAVVGFDSTLSSLTGIDFTAQNETPGLGARISEDWFREQFRGKSGPFTLVPEGTKATTPQQFDAITGATITSTAVKNIVNKTKENVQQIVQDGAN